MASLYEHAQVQHIYSILKWAGHQNEQFEQYAHVVTNIHEYLARVLQVLEGSYIIFGMTRNCIFYNNSFMIDMT